MERLVLLFSITIVVFAIGYAGSAAVTSNPRAETPVVARPLDAKALAKKLESLDARLEEAQASIDEVLLKLSTAREDSVVEASRVRLNVLYRLESGLTADIERTRERLQSLAVAGVK